MMPRSVLLGLPPQCGSTSPNAWPPAWPTSASSSTSTTIAPAGPDVLEVNPVVRVEFEQAFVLGRLGESLSAARHKAWGVFLGIRPLEVGDPVHPCRVTYAFKADAPYQKRFEQRRRLRRMLGKEYAGLVPRAMGSGKAKFLAGLSGDEAARVRARTGLKPGRFWRAAKGREFIAWPTPPRQLTLFDVD